MMARLHRLLARLDSLTAQDVAALCLRASRRW